MQSGVISSQSSSASTSPSGMELKEFFLKYFQPQSKGVTSNKRRRQVASVGESFTAQDPLERQKKREDEKRNKELQKEMRKLERLKKKRKRRKILTRRKDESNRKIPVALPSSSREIIKAMMQTCVEVHWRMKQKKVKFG